MNARRNIVQGRVGFGQLPARKNGPDMGQIARNGQIDVNTLPLQPRSHAAGIVQQDFRVSNPALRP